MSIYSAKFFGGSEMRKALRISAYLFGGLLSVSTIIWCVDWIGRWDWLIAFMLAHPGTALPFRSPIPYAVFLFLGLLSTWTERKVKAPHIAARFVNSRFIPDLHSTTMKVFFESQEKTPGWDEHRIDWDWFIEIQLVNDSEIRATLDRLRVEITLGPRWDREVFKFRHLEDLDLFDMDISLNGEGKGHGQRVFGERYQPVPSLMEKIRNVPLEQEIGYQG